MKTVSKSVAIALAAPIAVSTAAFAQANENIETISITGSRQPIDIQRVAGSVSVITADDIAQSGALDLTDMLRNFAGVSISQSGPRGALTELRLRGAESNHVLVLIDGIEVNDVGQGGLVDFAHLSLDNIERIELLRGPQSALWGSGAVAGVLSITTRQGALANNVRAEIGENSSTGISANVATEFENTSLSINASYYETDGQNISRQGDEKDGYEKTQVSALVNHEISRGNKLIASVRFSDFTNDYDAVDFFETGLPIDAINLTEGQQLSGKLHWQYAPVNSIWSQTLGAEFNQNENDNTVGGEFDGSTKGDKTRLFWLNTLSYAKLSHVSVVLETSEESFTQRGPVVFGDPNQDNDNRISSALIDWVHSVNRQFSVSGSYRYDDNDVFNNANSYRIGANYQVTPAIRTYASYGKAVKNPSFVERFGFFPADFQGNPDLIPEQSYTFEIGADFTINRDWQASLAWYDTDLENEINGFVFDPDTFQFTADNVDGTSKRSGVEATLQGSAGVLDLTFSYAYLDATEPDAEGIQQPELRRAEHTGSVVVNYPFSNRTGNVYVQANYVGERNDIFFPPFPNPSEVVELDSYVLVNLAVNYRLTKSWTLGARAENLLDEDYEDVFGFVGAGRSAYVSASYQW